MSAAEPSVRTLLAECGECGGLTTIFGQLTADMDMAQRRFRKWAEQVAGEGEGDYMPLAIEALKPVFLACEMANERVMFVLAVRRAAEVLERIYTPREPDVPPGTSPVWWEALSRDLHELKTQGLPDDDPRIGSILELAGQGADSIFEVGVEYRMKPIPSEALRLASLAKAGLR